MTSENEFDTAFNSMPLSKFRKRTLRHLRGIKNTTLAQDIVDNLVQTSVHYRIPIEVYSELFVEDTPATKEKKTLDARYKEYAHLWNDTKNLKEFLKSSDDQAFEIFAKDVTASLVAQIDDQPSKTFCCKKRCFQEPRILVSTVACTICRCRGYCKCDCVSFQNAFERNNRRKVAAERRALEKERAAVTAAYRALEKQRTLLKKRRVEFSKHFEAQIGDSIFNLPGKINGALDATTGAANSATDLMTTIKNYIDSFVSKFSLPADFDPYLLALACVTLFKSLHGFDKTAISLQMMTIARLLKIDITRWARLIYESLASLAPRVMQTIGFSAQIDFGYFAGNSLVHIVGSVILSLVSVLTSKDQNYSKLLTHW
jgi:hypothetical protein